VAYILGLKIITVTFENTKYTIYSTPIMPNMPMIHALQILVICMPHYHKSVLPRAEMDIFVCTKFASSSEFKCDSNVLIFSPIECQLSELHEFYKCTWKWKFATYSLFNNLI
jgi:hypothetical protein